MIFFVWRNKQAQPAKHRAAFCFLFLRCCMLPPWTRQDCESILRFAHREIPTSLRALREEADRVLSSTFCQCYYAGNKYKPLTRRRSSRVAKRHLTRKRTKGSSRLG